MRYAGDKFLQPTFHTIVVIAVYLCMKNKVLSRLTWLTDIIASGLLVIGTYERVSILDGKGWSHDCEAALSSDSNVVSEYFVFSLASWLALAILETKSCMYVSNAYFGKIDLEKKRTFLQWIKFFLYFLIPANSVLVMLHFCTDVHQTFEHLTKDTWLILYYLVAAVVKTLSVLLQGKN